MTWTIILGVRVRGSLADNADPISTVVEGDHTVSEAEAIATERATALGWDVIGVETSIYSRSHRRTR